MTPAKEIIDSSGRNDLGIPDRACCRELWLSLRLWPCASFSAWLLTWRPPDVAAVAERLVSGSGAVNGAKLKLRLVLRGILAGGLLFS
jgi:hypothetical protein